MGLRAKDENFEANNQMWNNRMGSWEDIEPIKKYNGEGLKKTNVQQRGVSHRDCRLSGSIKNVEELIWNNETRERKSFF